MPWINSVLHVWLRCLIRSLLCLDTDRQRALPAVKGREGTEEEEEGKRQGREEEEH